MNNFFPCPGNIPIVSGFCDECGAVLFDEGASFCSVCGAMIRSEEAPGPEESGRVSHVEDAEGTKPAGRHCWIGIPGILAIIIGAAILLVLSFLSTRPWFPR